MGEAPAARAILALFVLGLGLRWVWVLLHASSATTTFPDEQQYWNLAKSLAAGRGLVDEFGYRATFMPLYPAFLSLFVNQPHGMLLARLAQAAIGAAAVIPICLLGGRLGGRRAALVSGLLVAIDPFLVFGFANLVLTETIFTTLLCGAILAAWPSREPEGELSGPRDGEDSGDGEGPLACARGSGGRLLALRVRSGRLAGARGAVWAGIVAGVLFAVAIYVRPSVAALVPLWVIVSSLVARRKRNVLRSGAIMLATVVVLLLPWAVRNRIVLGQWVWLTTRSGISLYDGLGPRATGPSDLAYTKTMPNVKGMSETRWDAYFTRESWRIARDDPWRVVRLAWAKFRRTWSFVPNEPGSRTPLKMAVSAIWMTVVLAAAVIGVIRMRRGRDIVLLLLPAVYFTLLHMVYVGSVRYRIPAMPPLYVLSGWAVPSRKHGEPRGLSPWSLVPGAEEDHGDEPRGSPMPPGHQGAGPAVGRNGG
jgi:4-amino-4-deoxy-L-arabinose transferase-like glycosyltransferase